MEAAAGCDKPPADEPILEPTDGPGKEAAEGPDIEPAAGPDNEPADGSNKPPADESDLEPADGPDMDALEGPAIEPPADDADLAAAEEAAAGAGTAEGLRLTVLETTAEAGRTTAAEARMAERSDRRGLITRAARLKTLRVAVS